MTAIFFSKIYTRRLNSQSLTVGRVTETEDLEHYRLQPWSMYRRQICVDII